jgi:hypothetical protein
MGAVNRNSPTWFANWLRSPLRTVELVPPPLTTLNGIEIPLNVTLTLVSPQFWEGLKLNKMFETPAGIHPVWAIHVSTSNSYPNWKPEYRHTQ